MLSGFPPYLGKDVDEIFANIKAGDLDAAMAFDEWDDVSPAGKQFVRALLERDPRKRMTTAEALQHEWLCTVRGGAGKGALSPNVSTRLRSFLTKERVKKVALRLLLSRCDVAVTGDVANGTKGTNGVTSDACEHATSDATNSDDRNTDDRERRATRTSPTPSSSSSSSSSSATSSISDGRESIREVDLKQAFDDIDLDGNGVLDYRELCEAFSVTLHEADFAEKGGLRGEKVVAIRSLIMSLRHSLSTGGTGQGMGNRGGGGDGGEGDGGGDVGGDGGAGGGGGEGGGKGGLEYAAFREVVQSNRLYAIVGEESDEEGAEERRRGERGGGEV